MYRNHEEFTNHFSLKYLATNHFSLKYLAMI